MDQPTELETDDGKHEEGAEEKEIELQDSPESDKGPISVPVNQIAGQSINSTEQEVIGLLLAQQQVYGSSDNSETVDALSQDSTDSGTVPMVHPEDLRDDVEKESVSAEQEAATATIMASVESQIPGQPAEGYHTVQSGLASTELVQSVVVSSAYLEPQGVTLTEIPGGTIQALPGGGTFEAYTVHQASDGTSYVITSEGSTFENATTVSMATIADSRATMVTSTNETVDAGGITLDQFHQASQVEHDGHQTLYVHTVMPDDPHDHDAQAALKKIYHCNIDGCSKQFSTSYRLKAHGRSHTGDTFRCEEGGCAKSFITQSDLTKHIRTHSGEKPYRCDHEECGKVYTTAHHLKVHERTHTGEKPFKCTLESCGKAFATGYGLKSHTRTHTGEKPYKCPHEQCYKAFKTSGDLQKHIRTHTGERPFKCPFQNCLRCFTTSNIRKVHMRTHTGERPYVCEHEGCGRSFASATNFKNHSRIHTGERPYLCQVTGCNKRFTEYSSLYKHHVVHTHNKPYTCNICDKTYRQTSTLANHKRTAHGELTVMENMSVETEYDAEPVHKRQRIEYTDSMQGNPAFSHGVPVVVTDEASVAAIQAMDEIRQHIGDGNAVTGHISIPVTITTDASIQVQDPGSLEHSVTLADTIAQTTTSGQELDMTSPVHVVCAESQTVVALVEGNGIFSQDGKHQVGFAMVSGLPQGGEVQVEDVQEGVEEQRCEEEAEEDGVEQQTGGAVSTVDDEDAVGHSQNVEVMRTHGPTMNAKAALDAALARQLNQADTEHVTNECADMTSAAMTTVMTTVLQ